MQKTPQKILVVDDDIALRGMLTMSLEFENFEVTEASSAVEAIAILRSYHDDFLVVLDMGMPPNEHLPTEGIRVLDWITESAADVKVVVLTGQEADSTSYQAILHGAFDFLEKPVEFPVLLNALKRAILFNKQVLKIETQENIRKLSFDVEIGDGVKNVRNAAELKLLQRVLKETNFNVHETARRLGLKRENVYYLIKKYGIERDAF